MFHSFVMSSRIQTFLHNWVFFWHMGCSTKSTPQNFRIRRGSISLWLQRLRLRTAQWLLGVTQLGTGPDKIPISCSSCSQFLDGTCSVPPPQYVAPSLSFSMPGCYHIEVGALKCIDQICITGPQYVKQLRPLPDIFADFDKHVGCWAGNKQTELTHFLLSKQCCPNIQLPWHTEKMAMPVCHKVANKLECTWSEWPEEPRPHLAASQG